MSAMLDLVKAHYAATTRGDLDAATDGFDPEVETVTPNGTLKGVDEFRALGQAFLTAVPDQRLELIRSFEVGDTLIVEGVYSGTHTGPLVGASGTIPATGNAFAFPFVDIFEVRAGKCVSHRIYWDNVTFLSQLGVMSG